jgi:hypothetical protein
MALSDHTLLSAEQFAECHTSLPSAIRVCRVPYEFAECHTRQNIMKSLGRLKIVNQFDWDLIGPHLEGAIVKVVGLDTSTSLTFGPKKQKLTTQQAVNLLKRKLGRKKDELYQPGDVGVSRNRACR